MFSPIGFTKIRPSPLPRCINSSATLATTAHQVNTHFFISLVDACRGVEACLNSPNYCVTRFLNSFIFGSVSGSPLPDVIPHHFSSSPSDKKMSSVTTSTPVRGANELRVRRGMAPMRFRLNSVGSSVGSAATTPATSPLPYTPDMYYDDDEYEYYHQDLSAASTSSTFSYDDLPPFRPEDLTTSSISAVDATDASPSSSNNNDSTSSSTTADWRRVGRDLRGIADHFASTRHQTHQVNFKHFFLSDFQVD